MSQQTQAEENACSQIRPSVAGSLSIAFLSMLERSNVEEEAGRERLGRWVSEVAARCAG